MFTAPLAIAAACSNPAMAPAPPVAIAVTDGNFQSDTVGFTLPAPLLVTITDAAGAGVAGVTVTFVPSGGITLDHASVQTDASGEARVTATLGHVAGGESVEVITTGLLTLAEFSMTAVAGHAAALAIVSGNGQTAAEGTPVPVPLVVIVQDRYGNPVPGSLVIWSTTDGALSSLSSVSDFSGQTSVGLTLPTAPGTTMVTALLNGTAATVMFSETGS